MRFTLFLLPVALLLGQAKPTPIENEYVRVVTANDQPVAKPGSLHEHKQNRVMIYLDSGEIRIAYADGRVDDQHWKAGDVAWSPAGGMHTSQNVGSTPVHIVEIELRRGGAGVDTTAGAHPTIDNAQVHVYRSSKAPAAGKHYVAVDPKSGADSWDKLPEGAGPFVIVELK
jgi:quercetin dioxygenase-like cupin family protein